MDELVALHQRAVAIAASVADLAEREAQRAELRGNSAGARVARARAIRTRRAAAKGRAAARRLLVRHQAAQLLGPPRSWDAFLAAGGGSIPVARPPELAVAVIGTDLDGLVRLWNDAAERLYGWQRPEVLGRAIGELTVGPEDAEVAERIMSGVRLTGGWEGEFWVRRHDRTRFLAYVHDALVHDLAGRAVGVVGVSIDLEPGVLVQVPDMVDSVHANVVPLRRRPVP